MPDRAAVARTSRLDHGLYCADQVYWLIVAAGIDVPSEKLNTAVPEMVWKQVQGMASKRDILDKASKECEEIGFSMPQLLATALAGLRKNK
jgi:predicted hydrolase (HD superfamily)